MKQNVIKYVIIGVLAVLAAAGWTAFGVCAANCEKCDCEPEIIVECNCAPEVIVQGGCDCTRPPEVVVERGNHERHGERMHDGHSRRETKGPYITEPDTVTGVSARIGVINSEATIYIDVTYRDGTVETFGIALENCVRFFETYGEYTVDALFTRTDSGTISFCTVTRN